MTTISTRSLLSPLILAIAALAIPREASPITFTGEIVGTATYASNDAFWQWFDLGETWMLSYSYESDSIDGTFSRANGNLTLYHPSGAVFSSLPDCGVTLPCQIGPFLTVGQSIVTSFQFATSDLVWYFQYNQGTGGWIFDKFGGGPLTVTNPASVPDSTSSIAALGLAVVGLTALRRVGLTRAVRGRCAISDARLRPSFSDSGASCCPTLKFLVVRSSQRGSQRYAGAG